MFNAGVPTVTFNPNLNTTLPPNSYTGITPQSLIHPPQVAPIERSPIIHDVPPPTGRVSLEDKARRIASGDCLWCGKPGHIKDTCPILRAKHIREGTISFQPPLTPPLDSPSSPIKTFIPSPQHTSVSENF
jgi:hypothetical protein